MPLPRRILFSDAELQRLTEMLNEANGRRLSRTLSMNDVNATAMAALESPFAFSWRHGGEVDDARAMTTVCLAGARGDFVTIGAVAVHAKGVVPSWGWPDLKQWNRASDDATNSARVSGWARRRGPGRVVVPVEERASTSLEGLLAQILSHPNDDAPRLVYADALNELGDPRGELIALQCMNSPSEESRHRAGELISLNQSTWVPEALEVQFRRGFVEEVTIDEVEQLPKASAIAAREPVTRLVLKAQGVRSATSLRWLEQLESLELHDEWATHEDFNSFFDSRSLPRLKALAFVRTRLTVRTAQMLALVIDVAAPNLRELTLRQAIGAGALAALASRPWFCELSKLDLSNNDLRPEGITWLTGLNRPRFKSLVLDGNHLGDAGAFAIARNEKLTKLRALSLARNGIGFTGVDHLLSSPHLRGLTSLDLSDNPIKRARERLAKRFPNR